MFFAGSVRGTKAISADLHDHSRTRFKEQNEKATERAKGQIRGRSVSVGYDVPGSQNFAIARWRRYKTLDDRIGEHALPEVILKQHRGR